MIKRHPKASWSVSASNQRVSFRSSDADDASPPVSFAVAPFYYSTMATSLR